MSQSNIYVIPEDPLAVPNELDRMNAIDYLKTIAPNARDVSFSVSDHIRFVDAGSNFGKILCPSCRALVELRVWQKWMNDDFDGKGFVLKKHVTPCCKSIYTLQELHYEWPQGFGRFQIRLQDPGIGGISEEQNAHLQAILGCAIRVVYQRR